MIDGIVLAGGYSSRTKANKMTLIYQGKPLIAHVIENMHEVCERIIVVTGHHHEELSQLLRAFEYVTVAYNEEYDEGMFVSIQVGVKETTNDFFITPGDYPLIKKDTFTLLSKETGDIIVPSYQHRLGHPILFRKKYRELILNTDKNNLKDFRNQYEFTIVDVNDPGIIKDIDNMEDYNTLIGKE